MLFICSPWQWVEAQQTNIDDQKPTVKIGYGVSTSNTLRKGGYIEGLVPATPVWNIKIDNIPFFLDTKISTEVDASVAMGTLLLGNSFVPNPLTAIHPGTIGMKLKAEKKIPEAFTRKLVLIFSPNKNEKENQPFPYTMNVALEHQSDHDQSNLVGYAPIRIKKAYKRDFNNVTEFNAVSAEFKTDHGLSVKIGYGDIAPGSDGVTPFMNSSGFLVQNTGTTGVLFGIKKEISLKKNSFLISFGFLGLNLLSEDSQHLEYYKSNIVSLNPLDEDDPLYPYSQGVSCLFEEDYFEAAANKSQNRFVLDMDGLCFENRFPIINASVLAAGINYSKEYDKDVFTLVLDLDVLGILPLIQRDEVHRYAQGLYLDDDQTPHPGTYYGSITLSIVPNLAKIFEKK
ncbi:MAG: hypothetical protein KDD52_04735 [Bdellovibrionales bacterium]|nr:hypothetical protein [Bdellovibrionales bacterium]